MTTKVDQYISLKLYPFVLNWGIRSYELIYLKLLRNSDRAFNIMYSNRKRNLPSEFIEGNFLLIYICNFHVLSNLLLIYIYKLHWNLSLPRTRYGLFHLGS